MLPKFHVIVQQPVLCTLHTDDYITVGFLTMSLVLLQLTFGAVERKVMHSEVCCVPNTGTRPVVLTARCKQLMFAFVKCDAKCH